MDIHELDIEYGGADVSDGCGVWHSLRLRDFDLIDIMTCIDHAPRSCDVDGMANAAYDIYTMGSPDCSIRSVVSEVVLPADVATDAEDRFDRGLWTSTYVIHGLDLSLSRLGVLEHGQIQGHADAGVDGVGGC